MPSVSMLRPRGRADRAAGGHGPIRGTLLARMAVALVGLAGIVLAGCGSTDTSQADDLAVTSTGSGQNGSQRPETVASGLRAPWGLAFLPDRSALVAERDSGRIVHVPANGGAPTEIMRIPDVATGSGEGGLLGLAVSPGYVTDHLVYAYYTTATDNRIVRFPLPLGDTPPAAVEPILTGIAKATVHNGGRIAFGPDGMLYAGTGDASERSRAQDASSLNGKILRMRPDGSAPADNPDPRSLVYSLGHRNVQGLAWDSTGRLWATEFGQNTYDEVNLIEAGHNYGWPLVEGRGDTDGNRFTNPFVTWKPAESSPSGAAVIGDTLYVAALRGERLWAVPLDGKGAGTPYALLDGEAGRLRTAVAAPDGSLWITTSNTDGRGSPRDGDDRILRLTSF
ncbi:PQQ-dependent sugar dehydrogenase [Candidatus Protofrankia datiscae]|uniref:Glucose sorbosone dehydrogenase n=1 Tax=Candidatus Protofrankia datiscae TaxID=2716812 RepID=F8AZG3_9ACTN|nr:PQQ-dependent sugar dehydrogenase [Candidatus Protofrankia datiscae]AEH08638.1 glucose sorbosone dehydrogenase [Candidatus Protofrankia datiscae]